jgi:hypothetical protein
MSKQIIKIASILVFSAGIFLIAKDSIFLVRASGASQFLIIPDYYCVYAPANVDVRVENDEISICGYVHNKKFSEEFGVSVFKPVSGFWAPLPGYYQLPPGTNLIGGRIVAIILFLVAILGFGLSIHLLRSLIYRK